MWCSVSTKTKRGAKRHYPPAYYRYWRNHPAVTVRLTDDLKAHLDGYRVDLSYGKAIKKLLVERGDYVKGYDEGYAKGWEEGFDEAFAIEHFWLPCMVCGEPMLLDSEAENWDEVKSVLRVAFKNWAHTACLQSSGNE